MSLKSAWVTSAVTRSMARDTNQPSLSCNVFGDLTRSGTVCKDQGDAEKITNDDALCFVQGTSWKVFASPLPDE